MNMGDADYSAKLLLIGNSGVGKTCILQRFQRDEFRASQIPTIAIDFSTKAVEVRGRRLKMQIWDTAGQEKYNTLTTTFFKSTHAILLCFAIDDRASFDALNNWMAQVAANAPKNVLLVLVGNKADLQQKRVILQEEAEAMAHHFSVKFVEVSALSGENVEKVFKEIAAELVERFDQEKKQEEENLLTRKKTNDKKCCNQ